MKIRYLGHSSFLITTGEGIAVVCDPYDDSVGYRFAKVKADVVTVSHHHYDHDCIEKVSGSPVVLDDASGFTMPGLEIKAVQSFHDDSRGAKRGGNIIFKIRADGLEVCHLGDLGEDCSERLVNSVLPADVLLIPVGGNYTIDAATAKRYVDGIKPKVVIPMHYRAKGCQINIDKADGFLNLFDKKNIVRAGNEIELSREELGGDGPMVIFMEKGDD